MLVESVGFKAADSNRGLPAGNCNWTCAVRLWVTSASWSPEALYQLSTPLCSPFLRRWIPAGNTKQASTMMAPPRARSAVSRTPPEHNQRASGGSSIRWLGYNPKHGGAHACVAAWDPLTEHSCFERRDECAAAHETSRRLLAVGGEDCELDSPATPTPPH